MQIYEDRRALHRIPETGLSLPKTTAYVTARLKEMGCEVFHPIESSVCTFFDFGADSAIAFRADMDALRIREQTGLPFASEHEGFMHACGHDGHTAALLELARRLKAKKLDKNILLIFQPGEETPGGADPLCETGVLEKYSVETLFGLHLWPGLEKGCVYSRAGALMARSSRLKVTISGKAAHIGKWEEAVDAMAAGVQFYTKAMEMEKAIEPGVFCLLKFGRMESGNAHNIISAETVIEGSLRTYDDALFEYMQQKLYEIAGQVEENTGCEVSVQMSTNYPAVMNPEAVLTKVRQILEVREVDKPSMVAEDFSFYQKRVAALFFFLGLGDTPTLHANNFSFDEAVLLKGVELFETLAEQYR